MAGGSNKCSTCKKSYRSKHYLKIHERIHAGTEPFRCDLCDKRFNQKRQYETHLTLHTNTRVKCSFQCQHCPSSYSSKYALIQHVGWKHDQIIDPVRVCIFCNKQCPLGITEMEKHFRSHTRERPYFCKLCSGEFTHLSSLQFHEKTHESHRILPYECELCNRKFFSNGYLLKHLRNHTGERSFKCEVCQKGFKRKGDMAAHMRIHTGDRPYGCQFCEKKFHQSGNLTMHNRVHAKIPVGELLKGILWPEVG